MWDWLSPALKADAYFKLGTKTLDTGLRRYDENGKNRQGRNPETKGVRGIYCFIVDMFG